jgi:2,4-dienoyl-CoA reductase (NADPH2)
VTLRLGAEARADDLAGFDEVVIATGVTPRDPGIPTEAGANVLSYIDVLKGARRRPPRGVIGAGGIGFDVAEALVHEGPSPTLDPEPLARGMGRRRPLGHARRPGPEGPAPHPPAREVILLQRKAEKPGRHLGKTTGWIHRASLAMKGVRMQVGVTYERITARRSLDQPRPRIVTGRSF